MHITNNRTQTRNLSVSGASHYQLGYIPHFVNDFVHVFLLINFTYQNEKNRGSFSLDFYPLCNSQVIGCLTKSHGVLISLFSKTTCWCKCHTKIMNHFNNCRKSCCKVISSFNKTEVYADPIHTRQIILDLKDSTVFLILSFLEKN